jgi:hypothetical protein
VLRNLIPPGADADDELAADVHDELERYGEVAALRVEGGRRGGGGGGGAAPVKVVATFRDEVGAAQAAAGGGMGGGALPLPLPLRLEEVK